MPLLDHFVNRAEAEILWPSIHGAWANAIMAQLNRTLPRRYRAQTQVRLGRQVEADVVEIDVSPASRADVPNGPAGGVAVKPWAPPAARLTLPAVFPDDIIVPVVDLEIRGFHPVAVVELVSPGNKDRPETRRAFAAKSAAYLQRGIGLLTVDAVTARHFNLHNELMDLLRYPATSRMTDDVWIYSVSYRPVHRDERNEIEVWQESLAIGRVLPTMPLALQGAMTVPVDLEAAYSDACEWNGL
jgi:hypothetical protein